MKSGRLRIAAGLGVLLGTAALSSAVAPGVSAAKFHENVSDFGIVYGLGLQGLGMARPAQGAVQPPTGVGRQPGQNLA